MSHPSGTQDRFHQLQLNSAQIRNALSQNIIVEQKKIILSQKEEIEHLKASNQELQAFREEVEKTPMSFQKADELSKLLSDLTSLENQENAKLREKNARLLSEMRSNMDAYRTLRDHYVEENRRLIEEKFNVENLPKYLLDHFEKLKTEPEVSDSMDDNVFYREMMKRMACKICLSDVERYRCSKCLKGLCSGCHEKVPISDDTFEKTCPHCRAERGFDPIIIPRI